MGNARKIGDYVHWHAENYRKYGINKNTKDNTFNSYIQVKNKLQELTEKQNTIKIDEGYIRTIKNIMNPPETEDKDRYKDIQNMIIEKLAREYDKQIKEVIEMETLDIKRNKLKKYKIRKNQKSIKVSTLYKQLSLIEEFLFDSNGSISQDKLDKGQAEYAEILNEIYKIWGDALNDYQDELDGAIKNKSKKLLELDKVKDGEVPLRDLITRLNKIIDLFNIPSRAKGDFLEIVLAATAFFQNKKIDKEINKQLEEFLDKAVIGTSGKSNNQFNFEKFSINNDDERKYIKQKYFSNYSHKVQNENWVLTSIMKIQDKIDVEFKLDPAFTYRISAKNINPFWGKGNIHLVTDTSLFAIMNYYDDYLETDATNFFTHILNILAVHKESLQLKENDNNFLDALTMLLLHAALTGMRNTEKANIFVVNNNKTGEIKFFDVNTILANYEKIGLDISIGENELKSEILPQKFVGYKGAIDETRLRILTLLGNAHEKKMKVQLNYNELTKLNTIKTIEGK